MIAASGVFIGACVFTGACAEQDIRLAAEPYRNGLFFREP